MWLSSTKILLVFFWNTEESEERLREVGDENVTTLKITGRYLLKIIFKEHTN